MNDEEIRALEDPDYWDWERVQELPPEPEEPSVVGLALSDKEFDQVAQMAAREGVTMTAFMRDAALKASEVSTQITIGQEGRDSRRSAFGAIRAATRAAIAVGRKIPHTG